MQTRRVVVTLMMTSIPLLATDAVAQELGDTTSVFLAAIENIQFPASVYRCYADLSYYVNLVLRSKVRPDDNAAAIATYQLVGEIIRKKNANFDSTALASNIIPDLEAEYRREQLLAFLKSVGIEGEGLAGLLIEKSLVSMMLFHAAALRVSKIGDLPWCIHPFCFKRPA